MSKFEIYINNEWRAATTATTMPAKNKTDESSTNAHKKRLTKVEKKWQEKILHKLSQTNVIRSHPSDMVLLFKCGCECVPLNAVKSHCALWAVVLRQKDQPRNE